MRLSIFSRHDSSIDRLRLRIYSVILVLSIIFLYVLIKDFKALYFFVPFFALILLCIVEPLCQSYDMKKFAAEIEAKIGEKVLFCNEAVRMLPGGYVFGNVFITNSRIIFQGINWKHDARGRMIEILIDDITEYKPFNDSSMVQSGITFTYNGKTERLKVGFPHRDKVIKIIDMVKQGMYTEDKLNNYGGK